MIRMTSNGYECGVYIDYVLGFFGSYKRVFDNTMSIKMGIKNYSITDSFIFRHKKWITLKNEDDPSFDLKY